MRITIFSGDSKRHQFLVRELLDIGLEVQWFREQRKNISEMSFPEELSPIVRSIFDLHSKDWLETESDFFSFNEKELDDCFQVQDVISIDLAGKKLVHYIDSWNPELILSYGCSKIGKPILDLPGIVKLNIHGGLSPWYRGTITNFWPTYLLEPQFTGMTLHKTTSNLDAGNILMQTALDISKDDGVNQNSCKAVLKFIQKLKSEFSVNSERILKSEGIVQKSSGRIWTNKMWTPHHLVFVYKYMENRVNAYCIENNLEKRIPELINVIESI